MRNTKTILPVVCLLLASCALVSHIQAKKDMYAETCTKTDNYGTIDAYEILNIENKTTFKAAEYVGCDDGRNIVVVTWEGVHDKATANLAGQVMTKFFTHFHAAEDVQYLLVPEESGKNIFVYKFESAPPLRTNMSF